MTPRVLGSAPSANERLATKRFAALRALGTYRKYRAGAFLFREGDVSDHVVVLLSGVAKVVVTSESGYQSVLGIRSAGEIVGEFAAFDRRPRSASVQAITDIDSQVVGGDGFRGYLRTEPELALTMLASLVSRLRESDRRRVEFGALTVQSRLARLLLELGEPPGVTITLSQQDLAGVVGASREAVSRILRQFRERGAITTGRLRIVVKRPEILHQFSSR